MLRINSTDYRLIAELQQDGSVSNAELARKLGLTTKTVARRIKSLLQAGIISIIAQPNPYKLGLAASAMLAISSDPSKNDYVCDVLCKNFYVNHIQRVFGRFDILAFVFFPSWEMLHAFIYEELYRIDGVRQVEIYIINETFKRYERFFDNTFPGDEQPALTQTDWSLIEALSKNGRANPAELADRLGIHKSTVYRKIEALAKGNFFKIRAIPNPFKLSASANAYIVIEAGSADAGDICSILYPFDEVHFIMTTNQKKFIIVCVHAGDTDRLFDFIRKHIQRLEGISKTETFIRAAVQKTYYGWMAVPQRGERHLPACASLG